MAEITQLGRVRVAVESSFGQDGTGTMANFFSVRTDVGKFKEASPKRARIAQDPLRSFRNQKYPESFGFKHGTLEAGGQLCSIGTEIANGVTTTKDGISKLFEKILGGYRTGEGSVIASGASATGASVSAGDGAQFLQGQLIFVETALNSGIFVATVVMTRSTDALTWLELRTPSGAITPAVGSKVLNTQMVYETDQPSGTVQWLAEVGRDRDHIMLYTGCAGNLALEWPLGGSVMWTTQQQTTDWYHDDELAGVQGGSALAAAYAFDAGTPIIALGNGVHFGPTATTTTRVLPHVVDLTFDPGVTWTPFPSHNGPQGRGGFEAMPGEATGTISIVGHVETYRDARDAETPYRILAQAGNVGGKQGVLHLPRVQIVDIEDGDIGGIDCHKLTYVCLPASDFADQQTDVLRSRFYLGRG